MYDQESPPKKMLILGVVLLLLGLGGCGYGARAAKSIQRDLFDVNNAGTTLQLGDTRQVTTSSSTLLVLVQPSETTCSGASDAGASLEFGSASELPISTPDGSERYAAAYVLTVKAGADLTITCGAAGDAGRFAVASLPVSAGRLGLLATVFSGGGILLLFGSGFTLGGIVGRVRWQRRRRAAQDIPQPPPPGSLGASSPPPPILSVPPAHPAPPDPMSDE